MPDDRQTRLPGTRDGETDQGTDANGELRGTVVEPVPEEKHATAFAEFINKLSDEQWILWQKIGGVVLGLGAALCLFIAPSEGSFLPLNFIIAFGIAKVIPDVVEKQGERRISVGRIALIIALGAAIVGFVGYSFLTKGFTGFFAPTSSPLPDATPSVAATPSVDVSASV